MCTLKLQVQVTFLDQTLMLYFGGLFVQQADSRGLRLGFMRPHRRRSFSTWKASDPFTSRWIFAEETLSALYYSSGQHICDFFYFFFFLLPPKKLCKLHWLWSFFSVPKGAINTELKGFFSFLEKKFKKSIWWCNSREWQMCCRKIINYSSINLWKLKKNFKYLPYISFS